MDGGENLTAETCSAIADIGAGAWDALANPPGLPHDPFVSYAFLSALEDSSSVRAETGWAPVHLKLARGGEIAGLVPLYAKNHSQGEYVFDHAWADAYHRAGGRYYPKLQSAVPFTPATGRRLLTAPGDDAAARGLAAGLAGAGAEMGVSSVHLTFTTQDEWRLLGDAGFLQRIDQQFHWVNEGYGTFDDFLAALASRKRKALRKERAAASGEVDIVWKTGTDITESDLDAFWDFYQDTGARKWGQPYLTRTFFSLAAERLGDRMLLIFAERGGAPIAGALNFIGGETLFGRYWGCTEHVPFLHFELCYYQAIDFAIEKGLKRVEAGAQGEHKLARGYGPTPTYSAHWIADPGFRRAVDDYLKRERDHVGETIEMLSDFTPFKKDG